MRNEKSLVRKTYAIVLQNNTISPLSDKTIYLIKTHETTSMVLGGSLGRGGVSTGERTDDVEGPATDDEAAS